MHARSLTALDAVEMKSIGLFLRCGVSAQQQPLGAAVSFAGLTEEEARIDADLRLMRQSVRDMTTNDANRRLSFVT